MNKTTLKNSILALTFIGALSNVALAAETLNIEDEITQCSIKKGESQVKCIEHAISKLISDNPENAADIITQALVVAKNDATITAILEGAVKAGVDADNVTAIAIANGVDATLASQATAAGRPGGQATPGNSNSSRGAPSGGGGGGGGGISERQG